MRGYDGDKVAAGLGRGGVVGREPPHPFPDLVGQLRRVRRIDRAGVGHRPVVRRAILRQRPLDRAPIFAVLDEQRLVQFRYYGARVVLREIRPEPQRHSRPDLRQIARSVHQRDNGRNAFGNHQRLARHPHRVAQMQVSPPHMLHPHRFKRAQFGEFGDAHMRSISVRGVGRRVGDAEIL